MLQLVKFMSEMSENLLINKLTSIEMYSSNDIMSIVPIHVELLIHDYIFHVFSTSRLKDHNNFLYS